MYTYVDHCDAMPYHGPLPGSIEACVEPDPTPKTWPLFAAVTSVVVGFAAIGLGSLIGAVVAAVSP